MPVLGKSAVDGCQNIYLLCSNFQKQFKENLIQFTIDLNVLDLGRVWHRDCSVYEQKNKKKNPCQTACVDLAYLKHPQRGLSPHHCVSYRGPDLRSEISDAHSRPCASRLLSVQRACPRTSLCPGEGLPVRRPGLNCTARSVEPKMRQPRTDPALHRRSSVRPPVL